MKGGDCLGKKKESKKQEDVVAEFTEEELLEAAESRKRQPEPEIFVDSTDSENTHIIEVSVDEDTLVEEEEEPIVEISSKAKLTKLISEMPVPPPLGDKNFVHKYLADYTPQMHLWVDKLVALADTL